MECTNLLAPRGYAHNRIHNAPGGRAEATEVGATKEVGRGGSIINTHECNNKYILIILKEIE